MVLREPDARVRLDEPDFARDEVLRDEPERAFVRGELDVLRDELDLARGLLRDELDELREPDPERDALVRDELDLDLVLRDEPELPFEELRELLDELLELERRRELEPPLCHSAAGMSSRATALASCSICFSRNFAIRSSSRLMPRASFAVSLSPTVLASDSIPA